MATPMMSKMTWREMSQARRHGFTGTGMSHARPFHGWALQSERSRRLGRKLGRVGKRFRGRGTRQLACRPGYVPSADGRSCVTVASSKGEEFVGPMLPSSARPSWREMKTAQQQHANVVNAVRMQVPEQHAWGCVVACTGGSISKIASCRAACIAKRRRRTRRAGSRSAFRGR